MEYNIKKENRKKFQDKSKLKRHHKKDYSKVIPKHQPQETETKEDEVETEYEDVTDPEIDDDGNYILKEDEIEEINDEGQKVVRRKKIDKVNSNVWRYRQEIEIAGLDQDEQEMLKSIDFKKLDFNTIDSQSEKAHKDFKKMTKEELLGLKIIDEQFESKNPQTPNPKSNHDDDDDLDGLLRYTSTSKQHHQTTQAPPPPANKTPAQLKNDEAFLDDLI